MTARNISTVAFTAPQADRLAEALKRRTIQLGLSQKDLADDAGINRGHVARLQAGAIMGPKLLTLAKLERALQWPQGHAVDVARGDADPAVTYAEPNLPEPHTVELGIGDEWLILLRRAQSRSIMTQRAALAAARAVLDELRNGG